MEQIGLFHGKNVSGEIYELSYGGKRIKIRANEVIRMGIPEFPLFGQITGEIIGNGSMIADGLAISKEWADQGAILPLESVSGRLPNYDFIYELIRAAELTVHLNLRVSMGKTVTRYLRDYIAVRFSRLSGETNKKLSLLNTDILKYVAIQRTFDKVALENIGTSAIQIGKNAIAFLNYSSMDRGIGYYIGKHSAMKRLQYRKAAIYVTTSHKINNANSHN